MDKGEFVKSNFRVMPSGNGGVIALLDKGYDGLKFDGGCQVAFTTPAEFIEWLKGEYEVTDQMDESKSKLLTQAELSAYCRKLDAEEAVSTLADASTRLARMMDKAWRKVDKPWWDLDAEGKSRESCGIKTGVKMRKPPHKHAAGDKVIVPGGYREEYKKYHLFQFSDSKGWFWVWVEDDADQ